MVQVVPVAFSPDSRLLAAAFVSSGVLVWEVEALPHVEDFTFTCSGPQSEAGL